MIKETAWTRVRVGSGEHNYACGHCRTEYIGFASARGATEEMERHLWCRRLNMPDRVEA